MFMYIMAFVTVSTVITDFDAVSHIYAVTLTLGFTYTATNAIQSFHNDASEKGEKPYIIFTFSTVNEQKGNACVCSLKFDLI